MRKPKEPRVKRSRIILSAILTIGIAVMSLGFGAYLGYVTLNMNYLTIGTMTNVTAWLLVLAGFFVFLGCAGLVLAVKEIFISSRNEDKFSAYKGSLISGVVYYSVVALISIIGLFLSFSYYVPNNFTFVIIGLTIVSLALCVGAFFCVIKELREHKKKQKQMFGNIANMTLNAKEIHKFSQATVSDISQRETQSMNGASGSVNNFLMRDERLDKFFQGKEAKNLDNLKAEGESKESSGDIDFENLKQKLKELDDLRNNGLINDQEYQLIKKKIIK